MTPTEQAYSIQEVINLIDDRQNDNDPRADEAKKTLETIRQALQSQAEKDRVMKLMAEALEISIGYTALVADGVGKMPILKDRAKSDTEIISNAISEYTKLGGTQDE